MNRLRKEILGEFYSEEFNNLVNNVQRRFGPKYDSYAEDIVQNSFLRTLNTNSFHDPAKGSLKSWMYQITYNAAMDYMRTNQTKLHIYEEYDFNIPSNTEDNPLIQVMNQEALANLESKIEELPQLERHLIKDKINGINKKNTANELGISYNYSKWKTFIAKKKLQ
tara:strand:+ start:179 stop:676 length:498 start_codon:yes stop_codon:yes gene_type:complete